MADDVQFVLECDTRQFPADVATTRVNEVELQNYLPEGVTQCANETVTAAGVTTRTLTCSLSAEFLEQNPEPAKKLTGLLKNVLAAKLPAKVVEAITVAPGLCP